MIENVNANYEDDEPGESLSPWSHSINYGLLLGGLLVLVTYVAELAGISDEPMIKYANYILIIGLVVLAQRSFKDRGNSYMSYGQGLSIGSIIGLISSTINAIFLYIFMKYIDLGMIERMRELQVEALVDQGYDQDTIDSTMEMMSAVMTPGSVAGISILTFAFLTFVITLIITAFTRKDNPNKEFN